MFATIYKSKLPFTTTFFSQHLVSTNQIKLCKILFIANFAGSRSVGDVELLVANVAGRDVARKFLQAGIDGVTFVELRESDLLTVFRHNRAAADHQAHGADQLHAQPPRRPRQAPFPIIVLSVVDFC